jgi:hypothetical protein
MWCETPEAGRTVQHVPMAEINPTVRVEMCAGRSIEDFAKPGILAMLFLAITAMVGRMVIVFARVCIWRIAGLWRGRRSCTGRGPFNQLVEFVTIKPDPAALRAVVNFNALAFGHQQG